MYSAVTTCPAQSQTSSGTISLASASTLGDTVINYPHCTVEETDSQRGAGSSQGHQDEPAPTGGFPNHCCTLPTWETEATLMALGTLQGILEGQCWGGNKDIQSSPLSSSTNLCSDKTFLNLLWHLRFTESCLIQGMCRYHHSTEELSHHKHSCAPSLTTLLAGQRQALSWTWGSSWFCPFLLQLQYVMSIYAMVCCLFMLWYVVLYLEPWTSYQ